MRKLVVHAPAKLNLTFEISGLREDGYHQVSTLLHAVDLQDELSFEFSLAEEMSITLTTVEKGLSQFPLDESNLISRAFRIFARKLPGLGNLRIKVTIKKQIPIGAGLAGGSSNAAAALIAANYYFGHPLKAKALMELSQQLGADVPFCLEGGTCLGQERGDKLTLVSHNCRFHFLIVKPKTLSISTAWAYKSFDSFKGKPGQWSPPNTMQAVQALKSANQEGAKHAFGNVLEPVIFHHHHEVARLKSLLLELGVGTCHLTGSGPAIYAVVSDEGMAQTVKEKLLKRIEDDATIGEVDVLACASHNHGAKIIGEY